MTYRTLISTQALAAHIGDPDLAIVDCRYRLDDEGCGEREYAAAHIPDAVYADLLQDLSGPLTGTNGRHPLPDPAALARTFGRLGIAAGVQVVAYDQTSGLFASRLWWMLRWLGHTSAAVLDGGFAKWTAERRPTASGREARAARTFVGSPRPEMAVGAAEVQALLGRPEWRLVDARAAERYRGEIEPLDKQAGRIPGAANYCFERNVDERGTFRSPGALRQQLDEVIAGTPPDRIVCYCGSGVTACHNLLALEHAGLAGAKLYPGSWSEWSSDPSRPVERG